MSYVLEDMGNSLKKARLDKGLSQRALSTAAGIPQSHISKIETGAVDLRLSSLIDLARALDLELVLIPRSHVPAVRSLVRMGEADQEAHPAHRLVEDDDG